MELLENYCMGCGKPSERIMAELAKLPFVDRQRGWEGHRQFDGQDYYYGCDEPLTFCVDCGAKLRDEDIVSGHEFMGYFGSAPAHQQMLIGYTCSACGFKAEF